MRDKLFCSCCSYKSIHRQRIGLYENSPKFMNYELSCKYQISPFGQFGHNIKTKNQAPTYCDTEVRAMSITA